MSRIDEKTSIPLWWVAIAGVSILSWTWIGATWVKGVNDRLGRIEHYLGIPNEQVAGGPALIESAHARSEVKNVPEFRAERESD